MLPRASDADTAHSLARALGWALALVTLASLGILISRTLEMNGGAWSTLWPDLQPALRLTHFGHVWRWRIPALILAWLAWAWSMRHPRQPWTGWLIAIALAAIALTRSNTGHPADHGDFTFAVWVDFAHLLAAGTWVGSLFGMTLVVFPHLKARADPLPASARIFQRLSTCCGIALVVLLAGGILNAWQELTGVASLWTTRFGITLDVKLCMVLAMLAIGAHNRYVKLPQLLRAARAAVPAGSTRRRRTDAVRRCARAVLLESVLGLAVIGATATLIHTMPPANAPAMHGMLHPTNAPIG